MKVHGDSRCQAQTICLTSTFCVSQKKESKTGFKPSISFFIYRWTVPLNAVYVGSSLEFETQPQRLKFIDANLLKWQRAVYKLSPGL